MSAGICALEWTRAGLRWAEVRRKHGRWSVVNTLSCDGPEPNLKAFVAEHNLAGRAVSLALPRSEAIVSWRMSGDQSDFPMPLRSLASASLMSDEGTTAPVLTAAIANERVEHYRRLFADAKLRLNGIGLNFISQLRGIADFWSPSDADIAVLDIAIDPPQITFAKRAFPIFCRSLSPLAEEDSFLAELEQSFAYVASARAEFQPRTLLLTSRQPKDAALIDHLARRLGLTVMTDPTPGNGSMSAIGLAIAAHDRNGLWIVPPHVSAPSVERIWKRHHQSILSAASLLFVLSGLAFDRAAKADQTRLDALSQQVRASRAVGSSRPGGDRALRALADVLTSVPAGCYLIDYTYDAPRSELIIRGRSADYARVAALVAQLAKSDRLSNVRSDRAAMASIGDKRVVEFSVSAALR